MEEDQLSPLASRLADVLAGSYTIEGEIGRGGMGVVYSARDLKLKRRVAIKLLPPELAFRQEIKKRFIREAQTAARLSHPHIVPIHAVGDEANLVYFVMGYVDGESLAARLRRRGRLPVEECRRVLKETADALGLAHAMGIVHRDIKPDNILLDGTRRRVMVTDFGIAKALSDAGGGSLTGTGVALGTPTYMSPEQAAGESEIDARSDIYSLGIVGFEMLAGRPPFKAPTVPGVLMKQITELPPDLLKMRGEIPEELATSIMRCLDKDPQDRWPTADALRRALESRNSGPYRPRSSMSRRPGQRVARRPSATPSARERQRTRSPSRPEPKRAVDEAQKSEPDLVRKFRSNFASYVSVNGGLLLLNVVTGIESPWFLFPAIGWGIGIASQYGKLWATGYSMRDVLSPPAARDAVPRGTEAPALPVPRPPLNPSEFGRHASSIEQMRKDQAAIAQVVKRLPEADQAMLPDVLDTVTGLMTRAEELGRTLHQMDGGVENFASEEIEGQIAALRELDDPQTARRIDLLERQLNSIQELEKRRAAVENQFHSCVLAVQNIRFDMLRLRSAGVSAVLADLTSATQQASALRIDVEAAIDAAGEIREALGRG